MKNSHLFLPKREEESSKLNFPSQGFKKDKRGFLPAILVGASFWFLAFAFAMGFISGYLIFHNWSVAFLLGLIAIVFFFWKIGLVVFFMLLILFALIKHFLFGGLI